MSEDDRVPGNRILVMEDDNSLRSLFVEVMELEGHAADGALPAKALLAAAQRSQGRRYCCRQAQ